MSTFEAEPIGTRRLILLPLWPEHAGEMAGVLADPALHEFIGGAPLAPQDLQARYERLADGSPDPAVSWCNWVIQLRDPGSLVGTVQATISGSPDPTADVAWVVGTVWQSRGIATEAARALISWLGRRQVRAVIAHIYPGHVASAAVAAAAGLRPTNHWQDGEQRWELTLPPQERQEGSRAMSDRVAIVTGAGSGIGRGIAQHLAGNLAGNGVRVVVADVDEDGGQETVAQITGAGGAAMFVRTDVRLATDAQAMVDACISEYGTPDYLVNNAGLVTMTPFLELPEEEWDLVLDVNVKGQFLCGQAFSRALVAAQRGGAIVNIGSVESEVITASGEHCQVHYNVSKGGVKMLTRGMAFELARHDIRVNGINPGTIDTEFAGPPTERGREFFFSRALIKRLGQPVDIARAVWFLLSDDASFITGTMLSVDGGWLVQ